MSDIDLIIKISEKDYNRIKDIPDFFETGKVYKAIQNGIVLPKGHGRILDEKEILDTEKNDGSWYDLVDLSEYIAGVPAIIEADKEEVK